MSLNIKNRKVEELLETVVQMTGESKTEAVRLALAERLDRLSLHRVNTPDQTRFLTFLQNEIWAQIPARLRGIRLSKEEEADILGYEEWGVFSLTLLQKAREHTAEARGTRRNAEIFS